MPYTPDWGVPPPRHYGTSPGPGRGSESSRAQHPAPRGTPRRQHPPRGLVGALGGPGGHREAEGRVGLGRCAMGEQWVLRRGVRALCGLGVMSAAEAGVLRKAAGGGH